MQELYFHVSLLKMCRAAVTAGKSRSGQAACPERLFPLLTGVFPSYGWRFATSTNRYNSGVRVEIRDRRRSVEEPIWKKILVHRRANIHNVDTTTAQDSDPAEEEPVLSVAEEDHEDPVLSIAVNVETVWFGGQMPGDLTGYSHTYSFIIRPEHEETLKAEHAKPVLSGSYWSSEGRHVDMWTEFSYPNGPDGGCRDKDGVRSIVLKFEFEHYPVHRRSRTATMYCSDLPHNTRSRVEKYNHKDAGLSTIAGRVY